MGAATLVLVALALALFVGVPVARVLVQPGPADWAHLLATPRDLRLLGNTLLIAALSTVSAVAVAFLFAYATWRPEVPGHRFFRLVAIMPLVSPPFVGGLAFILLFGRRGLVTWSLLGLSATSTAGTGSGSPRRWRSSHRLPVARGCPPPNQPDPRARRLWAATPEALALWHSARASL